MPVKLYKPTTPSRRGMTTKDNAGLYKGRPVKSLVTIKKSTAGRNNQGRITTRHRGGGVKNFYRHISFSLPTDFVGTVERLEYDPNRSAHIALLKDEKSQKMHYVIATTGMTVGQKIQAGAEVPIEKGNRLPLSAIPLGTYVNTVELQPGKGGQLARSAGAKVQLMAREGDYAQLKMPSGEVRKVRVECTANIGGVGNEQHQNVKLGNAGRRRRKGWRPAVKGRAMNASDHPMGGGDGGKGSLGGHPKTPWGQPTLGKRTRRRKDSSKYIVRSRHMAKRK